MTNVITGSRGYIGKKLFSEISKKGYVVVGLDIQEGHDICELGIPDYDVVYHLAAQAGVPESFEDPIRDAYSNILATLVTLKAKNSKIIFTTSGAALEPESPYGLSKRTAEEYIKMLCDDYVILRLSSVYGDKPKGVVDNFIRGDKCTIYGDGSSVRDFVHVDDVVKALIQATKAKKGVYQIGSGKGVSVKEIAEATGKPIEYLPEREGEKKKVVLKNELPGWEPKIDVISYVKEKCKTSTF